MTLTGTFVLALPHGDTLQALAQAAELGTAALGLLLRYLTRPPAPASSRAEVADGYGLSVGQLRAGNSELAEAGYLMQARRSVGRGRWQHLIVVVDKPGTLPAEHQAWVVLDAALAADTAAHHAPISPHISCGGAHVATCDDPPDGQVPTCDQKPPIEPVIPGPRTRPPDHGAPPPGGPAATVVKTVAELKALAALPPLPPPADGDQLWLTPGQVVTLTTKYPPAYGDLALGVLARQHLPWYLAPRVMALLMHGYTTDQLARALTGVHDGEHPAAIARWRLDQLILAPAPDHVPWTAPSTSIRASPTGDPAQRGERAARGAEACRAGLRARGIPA